MTLLLLWLGGASPARAEGLDIDLRTAPTGHFRHDDGADPATAPAFASAFAPPSFVLSPGSTITRVRAWPWPPTQGQTLALAVGLDAATALTLTFAGQEYPVFGTDGVRWAFVPIPPLAQPGNHPLVLTDGEQGLTLQVPVRAGSFPSVNIPPATTAPILSQGSKVSTEAARMAELFSAVSPGGWNLYSRFDSPLHGELRRTSPFGSRRTYGTSTTITAHEGEDYGAVTGTPVYAPAPGVVVLADPLFVRGNAIVIDHGNGVYTGYWHLSEFSIEVGESVETGQLIGKVGSTGLSTGAHLHRELRVGGRAVDPLQWLRQE